MSWIRYIYWLVFRTEKPKKEKKVEFKSASCDITLSVANLTECSPRRKASFSSSFKIPKTEDNKYLNLTEEMKLELEKSLPRNTKDIKRYM